MDYPIINGPCERCEACGKMKEWSKMCQTCDKNKNGNNN